MIKWALCCVLLLPLSVVAEERILDFHSDILIMEDGWIDVTETIKVRAEGFHIRRGIYRDFPTEYYDRLQNRYEVDFEPISVLRNGQPEDFHSENIRDGVRTYFGRSDRYIENGEHTYAFRYKASRMLGFFENHDELYWNVTGFNWAFPIDRASATVTFEFTPPSVTHEAYTGPFGATGRNYTSVADGSSRVDFNSNAPLSATNGLTIVVGWPKGYVAEPSRGQRFGWLLKDNMNLLAAMGGLLALIGYYLVVWFRFGKDPQEGVIVTRYEPPEPYSPASLRYIRQMYYDNKVMTAAVVNLAVKGYLRIDVSDPPIKILGIGIGSAKHSLTRLAPGESAPPLAPGEKELYQALFKGGDNVELDNKNHVWLGAAKRAHKKSLKRDYNKRYFQTNGTLNIPGVLIVVAATPAALTLGTGMTLFVIPLIVLMIITLIFFAVIMKRPTIRGRKVLDAMLGFKDYLEVAEKDELNQRNPPEKTPQLFEAYLPYALALDVDQQWAEKFADVFASIGGQDGQNYQPSWYSGNWDSNSFSNTTNQFSSALNSAISSSVSPPGSSSGGGGGGSSGGGGGGGGGGGW
ncbi:MAG: DUF2207 domain-containing protein [Gammaproteobacteria bacterium]|nr:DUF2207 domain-containing protein [Gammaproteobacteria bacterium]